MKSIKIDDKSFEQLKIAKANNNLTSYSATILYLVNESSADDSILDESFGDLTVLRADPNKKYYYVCECICGMKTSVRKYALTCGEVISCGCAGSRTKPAAFKFVKSGHRL